MLLSRGLYDDLHVLAECREEVHEAFDGKGAGTIAHQCGNVRLLDAENLSRFRLIGCPDEASGATWVWLRETGVVFSHFAFGLPRDPT
jgi:hypothetical protein